LIAKQAVIVIDNSSIPAQISQDFLAYHRIHFLYAAYDSGLLAALRMPSGRGELIARLGVKHPELLDSLLDLGVLLEEFSLCDGCYKITGQYTKSLMEKDALAAVIQQIVTVNGPVFRRLSERLKGAPPGDYLSGTGSMFARSARMQEPLIAAFLRAELEKYRPLNILEVGCGSGIYLKHAVQINPRASGVGLDMQEDVIKLAGANLEAWGIDDRFKVIKADIRQPLPELAGPFDVILLLNNIFYFPLAERPALFRCLHSLLAPEGTLYIVSVMKEKNIRAVTLDLVLKSTLGCAPLPCLKQLTAQLKESGLLKVSSVLLSPALALYGVKAKVSEI